MTERSSSAVLSTPRLWLGPHGPDDAPFLVQLNQDPEVVRYTGDEAFSSVDEAMAVVQSLIEQWQARQLGRLLVVERSSKRPVGWCGLKWSESEQGVDLGFRFLRSVWGRGYATEAGQACLVEADRRGLFVFAKGPSRQCGFDSRAGETRHGVRRGTARCGRVCAFEREFPKIRGVKREGVRSKKGRGLVSTIEALNPDPTKQSTRVDEAKYNVLKSLLLSVVPANAEGVAFGELRDLIKRAATDQPIPEGGSLGMVGHHHEARPRGQGSDRAGTRCVSSTSSPGGADLDPANTRQSS